MAEDVLFVEGLLDEEKAELVQAAQVLGVLPVIGGVGVHLEHELGAEHVANGADRSQVPPRLDLQLHPLVALRHMRGDDVEQLVDRAGDANGHADGDAARRAAEIAAKRRPLRPQLGIKDRHLNGCLGHPVALQIRQESRNPLGSEIYGTEQPWDDPAL